MTQVSEVSAVEVGIDKRLHGTPNFAVERPRFARLTAALDGQMVDGTREAVILRV